MGRRPADGIVEKSADSVDGDLIKILAFFSRLQDVPPGGQEMEPDSDLLHGFQGAGKGAVEEDDENVRYFRSGVSEALDEGDLGAAVGGQVLDQ